MAEKTQAKKKLTKQKKVVDDNIKKETKVDQLDEVKKTVFAHARYLRSSQRKARLVVDMIRGKSVEVALNQLSFLNKKAAGFVKKAIISASSNAVNNFDYDRKKLVIKEAYATDAPTYKRWRAGSRGRFKKILKRNCHITIGVAEK